MVIATRFSQCSTRCVIFRSLAAPEVTFTFLRRAFRLENDKFWQILHKNRTRVAPKTLDRCSNNFLHGTHGLRFVETVCTSFGPFQLSWSAEKQSTRRSTEKHKNRVFSLNRYQSHLSAINSLKLRILSALREWVYRHF